MRRLLVIMFILLFFGIMLAQWLSSNDEKTAFPWEIKHSNTGTTQVFNLDIGHSNLYEMMQILHKIPEVNIFEEADENRVLEAYFAKMKLGIFDAILIAELDSKAEQLEDFIAQSNMGDRKAMPSGRWKYTLTENSVKIANRLRVWRLIYIPIAKYTDVSLQKQFGEPAEKETLDDTLSYWYYPKKGLAILYDKKGSEIFYYVAKHEFARLKAALPKQKQEIY